MTRDEVIKGLELCITPDPADCSDCPAYREDVKQADENHYIRCRNVLMREALALLKREPKRGRWITYPECLEYEGAYPECLEYEGAYSEYLIVCSECESVWSIMDNDTERFRFCPNCGAEMEEEHDKG